MEEEWRDVVGYEENYQVSSLGQVRSKPRQKRPGRILKQNEQTYKCVSLSQNNIIKTHTVHRLVALAFIPNPLNLQQVDHIDRNKLNNTISNLRWVSAAENQQNKGMPKHNTSGEMYIYTMYRVCIIKNGKKTTKVFNNMEDAKAFRHDVAGF